MRTKGTTRLNYPFGYPFVRVSGAYLGTGTRVPTQGYLPISSWEAGDLEPQSAARGAVAGDVRWVEAAYWAAWLGRGCIARPNGEPQRHRQRATTTHLLEEPTLESAQKAEQRRLKDASARRLRPGTQQQSDAE